MSTDLCSVFLRQRPGAYKPLVCKDIVANTRSIRGSGQTNKLDYFFLMKPNTMRENATLDLIYTHPTWLKEAVQSGQKTNFIRITSGGFERITTDNFVRITA